MNKKGIIVAAIGIAILVGIGASFSSYPSDSEYVNLDMGRTHGTISTAMGDSMNSWSFSDGTAHTLSET